MKNRTKLLNKIYGRLTVVSFAYSLKNKLYWNCLCECGAMCIAPTGDLNQKKIVSCGCKRKEGRKRVENLKEEFEKQFIIDGNNCWLWQGKLNGSGYGSFCINGVNMGAHRASKIIYSDLDITNKYACHSCDIRNCVNPDHIWIGTNSDNMADAALKGRNISQLKPHIRKGESNGNSKLKLNDVLAIRSSTMSNKELAIKYNIHSSQISKIKANKAWRTEEEAS